MLSIPKTMRAVVYRGANDLRVETVPVPAIRADELLVKVAACGVCPTDIKKIQHGTVPPPRIFGHETAGVIVRAGARVRGFRVGERVALHHHVPCLECHACRHHAFAQCAQYKRTGITAGFEPAGGGYAEYVRVLPFVLPGVVKIPARNSFLEGAMFEPVNTVLKGIQRLALLRGDTVLVAGQGPIGLMFTRLLALRGMKVLATDLMESRLRLAQEFGAAACRIEQKQTKRTKELHGLHGYTGQSMSRSAEESATLPAHQAGASPANSTSFSSFASVKDSSSPSLEAVVAQLTAGRGLDAAVIAVPSADVVRQAQALVRGAGQVLLFAHTRRGDAAPVDLGAICADEKDLVGSYSSDFRLQDEVARLVFARKLDVRRLITHQFPLDQTAAAVELASHPTADSLKVVVTQD